MEILFSILIPLSTILTIVFLVFAISKRSWKAMLISFIASLPVSLYFTAFPFPYIFIGLIPLITFLLLTIFFRIKFKEQNA